MTLTSLWLEFRDFLSYIDASLRAGSLGYGGLAEPALEAVFLYVGMLLAARVTAFRVNSYHLLITAVLATAVGHVPGAGWVLSPMVMFLLLKQFSDSKGLFLMTVCSWAMSLAAASLVGKPIY